MPKIVNCNETLIYDADIAITFYTFICIYMLCVNRIKRLFMNTEIKMSFLCYCLQNTIYVMEFAVFLVSSDDMYQIVIV